MRHRRHALAKYVLPLGALGLAAVPTLAAGAPATFAPVVNYPLGQSTSFNLGIGDFNADGNLDVASGGLLGEQSFVLLPGVGDGTFGTANTVSTPVTAPPTTPGNVASGDLNNDGKPDLVFATNGGARREYLVALDQTTGGAFNFTSPTAMSTINMGGNNPGTPALGDLNEDGKLDVVTPITTVNAGFGDFVESRLGNGDGTFQAANPVFTNPTGPEGAEAAAIADVNGDGHLDVVATKRSANGVQHAEAFVALGHGDGTFQPATSFDIGRVGHTKAILATDLDGDGDTDIATTVMMRGSAVLLGNGDGTFQPGTLYPTLGAGYDIAAADLNGDGIKDLAATDPWTGNSVDIALGNGDGTFATPTNIAMPTGSNPYGIALNDVNGDGLADVLAGSYGTQSLSVLINTSVAMAPAVTAVSPSTGPAEGGTSVTITGTAFTGATAVTFGGVNATSFTVNSATSITAVAPPHAGGAVAIAVTTPNGTGTAAGVFTYAGAPTPDPSPSGGGTSPGAGEASLPAATTPESTTPGYLSMSMPRTVSGRRLVSSGVVPPGADRITQMATSGASGTARTVFGAWSTARAQTSCPITERNGRSTFTCTLRLAPGRWTVTTTALSGSTTVSRSVATVRMRAISRVSVTG